MVSSYKCPKQTRCFLFYFILAKPWFSVCLRIRYDTLWSCVQEKCLSSRTALLYKRHTLLVKKTPITWAKCRPTGILFSSRSLSVLTNHRYNTQLAHLARSKVLLVSKDIFLYLLQDWERDEYKRVQDLGHEYMYCWKLTNIFVYNYLYPFVFFRIMWDE